MTEEAEVLDGDFTVESENLEPTPESSPETEQPVSGEPEQGESTGENQDQKQPLFSEEGQKLFNAKMAEEKRAKRELEARLKELESQVPQNVRPEVPDMPDPYSFDTDEEYNRAVRARDEALTNAAIFDAQQKLQAEQVQQLQQQEQLQKQVELQQAAATYMNRATQLGVGQEELQAAGLQIQNYGIANEVQEFILRDDHGPLITKYLGANPLELESLRLMDPMSAAVKITTDIKAKAANLRPKTTKAPAPIETFNGAGQSEKFEGPEGATFE